MILAAGRGERMRPLSDTTPKPLLEVAGEPLIVRQIRALARAGIRNIAINVSHLGEQIVEAVGDGRNYGVTIHWSRESEPLETAGGIATAMPYLPTGPAIIVSGDIWTAYDYASLLPVANRIAERAPHVHLVMVPNPRYHPRGDFALRDDGNATTLITRLPPSSLAQAFTYGNIGVYDTALFRQMPRGVKLKLLPFLNEWIDGGRVTGEIYEGPWENVGTPAELAGLNAALAREPNRT
ncbi:MAG TPA: nucleotidyltransferase family protein [Casimicrobiaceae bacterium]|nr:nucleotidyltransferase family protein [Casimicrobiaceae bacterium]